MSVTKIDIWKDPIYKIKDLIEELSYTSSTLQEATCENIVERICNDASQYASYLNAVAPQSGTDKSIVGKEIDGRQGSVYLSGKSAVYDEFGTGEEGALNAHPMKANFALNPYNSGPFVSTHLDKYGQHFWFYTPMAGREFYNEKGLTYGIPSGKQMYNTLQYIRGIKKDIISEEINEAIQTLK